MRNNNPLVLFLLAGFVFVACKQKNETASGASSPAQTLPDDFEVFYEKFHQDTAYQLAHIIFPLEGRPALRDDMPAPDASFRWQKEDWLFHKPYDDMGGTFSRSFLSFSDIVTENIEEGTGQFTMTRRFAKMDGDWYLIYYKEMGK